ncbi:glycine zipper 2TM domain-containing protein [Pseudomonas sp. CC6-YY-74]|uniref:glycine zipper 2TM domain-containing protein n=1 Tax=Pseudomonas sp. CC6-YY-74 TaxID=1930532 RepID=UPI0009A1B572|nr:glycine zipper 2TM domain-containing protein [Pseudomonas sp. CC6-YY-74]
MTTMKRFAPMLGLAGVLALSACTSTNPPATTTYPQGGYQDSAAPGGIYSGYGRVESIDSTPQDYQGVAGTGFGLGSVAGAVLGGVAGNQVGGGSGNTAATIAGAAGGAYIGHQIEKRKQAENAYRVTVRMENGSYQTLTQTSIGDLRVGDRVRIENGALQRY